MKKNKYSPQLVKNFLGYNQKMNQIINDFCGAANNLHYAIS